jgi:hypothetical protein
MPVGPTLPQGCKMAIATPVFLFISHISCRPRLPTGRRYVTVDVIVYKVYGKAGLVCSTGNYMSLVRKGNYAGLGGGTSIISIHIVSQKCLKSISSKNASFIILTAVLLLSVFAALTLASTDISIAVTAHDNVSICENATYSVNITNTKSTPIYNITLNVTMPDGFWYNANTTNITFPGGTSSKEPSISGSNLSWNLSEIIGGGLNATNSTRVTFNLTTGCNAGNGKRLKAAVKYDGKTSTEESNPITVCGGYLKLTKLPSIIEASKGELVEWNLSISNTGIGAIRNTTINELLGDGLELVSITSPNSDLNWSYAMINASETKNVMVRARVIACENLENCVEGRWGCGGVCQETYTKAGVKIILKEPHLDYAISPSIISTPYCGAATVSINITNFGEGSASDIDLQIGIHSSQYNITNVTNATYNSVNSTFEVGSLTNGRSKIVTFDFGMSYGACDVTGGTLSIEPRYEDDCGNVFAPPTKLLPYSIETNTYPSLDVAKTGPPALYLAENGTYVVSVTYHNGSCAESINVTINDTIPSNFEIIDNGSGSVSGNTIAWGNVQLTSGTEWSRTIKLRASSDPCDCGHVFTNTLAVDGGNDCCGCPLSGNASVGIMVECNNETVFTSGKTAAPTSQENCRNITYTTIYNFTNVGSLNWSDINFTEQGNNNQTFLDGTNSGNATFTVNDTCSQTQTIALGSLINLGFLDAACRNLTDGTNLSINYTLYQHNTRSFVDWSDLDLAECSSNCSSDTSFHEGVRVDVGRSNFSISLIHPNSVDSCGRYNFTICLAQNSVWDGYNMSTTYDGSDFPYLNGTANITGIRYYNSSNQSYDPVPSFEPTKDGDNYVWNFSQNYTVIGSGGRIEFGVIKGCPETVNISTRLDYEDNCGHFYNDTFSSIPLLINRGDLIITKTPEIVYAYTKNVS